MTTLEGEFVTNSKFIDWLIRLMMSSSPDTDTDEVIRAAVLKALSDATHVKAMNPQIHVLSHRPVYA
jgi:hypothetical protein